MFILQNFLMFILENFAMLRSDTKFLIFKCLKYFEVTDVKMKASWRKDYYKLYGRLFHNCWATSQIVIV